MKKFLLSITALYAMSSAIAQMNETIGFESFSLAPNSYYNGSDMNGSFTINNATFYNYYDPTYFFWVGYSVSNVEDNTTAGFGNQYASYAFGGANSSNYAVFYPDGRIDFAEGVLLDSVKITNTTYAAISMRDGDAYAKQFGSVNDAQGNPDGTNGEDFLILDLFALDQGMNRIDSIEIVLADYRFSDNSLDYILDEWMNVDLSSISDTVYALEFEFRSSDVGQFGINTPTYFAMDDLSYRISNTVSVNDLEQVDFNIYPNPANNFLYISGLSGEITLVNSMGQIVMQKSHDSFTEIDLSTFNSGLYNLILKSEDRILSRKISILK